MPFGFPKRKKKKNTSENSIETPAPPELKHSFTLLADEAKPLREQSQTSPTVQSPPDATPRRRSSALRLDVSTKGSEFFSPLLPDDENPVRTPLPKFGVPTTPPSSPQPEKEPTVASVPPPRFLRQRLSGFSLLDEKPWVPRARPASNSRVHAMSVMLRSKRELLAAAGKEERHLEVFQKQLEARRAAANSAQIAVVNETEILNALIQAVSEDCATTESLVEKRKAELAEHEAAVSSASPVVSAFREKACVTTDSTKEIQEVITRLQANIQHVFTALGNTEQHIIDVQRRYQDETKRLHHAYQMMRTRAAALDRLSVMLSRSTAAPQA